MLTSKFRKAQIRGHNHTLDRTGGSPVGSSTESEFSHGCTRLERKQGSVGTQARFSDTLILTDWISECAALLP